MLFEDNKIHVASLSVIFICSRNAGPNMGPLYNTIYLMRFLKGEGQSFCQAFYQFSSKSLEHECNIFLSFYANPFSALLHFQL